ncbi:hypothetical protein [Flavobacterium sp.]|uniref:hypothetical protein n=1 Tax=Flavobacterium sp. TaxID=239 RepID=UPI0025BBFBA8|nr:hypothetical protein [Flavobacterium sp.]
MNTNDKDRKNDSELDSKVNTDSNSKGKDDESLTNDESADTDPNEVPDKPSFDRSDV